jgi:hypothetical protein
LGCPFLPGGGAKGNFDSIGDYLQLYDLTPLNTLSRHSRPRKF